MRPMKIGNSMIDVDEVLCVTDVKKIIRQNWYSAYPVRYTKVLFKNGTSCKYRDFTASDFYNSIGEW